MGAATAGVSAHVLFVVGASGAGRPAVGTLERRGLSSVRCYYFDAIGVPSPEEMERQWGGGDR